jgi:hypothetical protein
MKQSKLKGKDPTEAQPSRLKMQIFGPPGIGKTWGVLEWPACYYIDTEGGANLPHYSARLKGSGGVYLGPEDGSLDFASVLEQCAALASEAHPYKTLVIDSVSKLFNHAVAMEGERLGDKNAFGADKKPAIASMRRLIMWINRLDMNVVLIAHEKPQWGDDGKGGRAEIGKVADSWDKTEYELNLNLHITKRGASRYGVVKKSRLTGFHEGEAVPWGFAEFASRYGGEGLSAEAKVLTLATPEQVARIKELVAILHVTADDVDKWLDKAGASSLEEMDATKAEKLAAFLVAKLPK